MIELKLRKRLLNSWKSIQQITTNPNSRTYQRHNRLGRRINNQFSSFGLFCDYIITQLGPPPDSRSRLARRDQYGDYAPGNLTWADSQYIGTRYDKTIWVQHQGHRVRLTLHAESLGINKKTILSRYWAGDRDDHLFRSPS